MDDKIEAGLEKLFACSSLCIEGNHYAGCLRAKVAEYCRGLVAELEADLHAKNLQLKGYAARLKDEARLLLAAKKVSEVAWIVGALEAKGWTCMEDEHEAFAELSGAIEAVQASERKDG